MARIRETRRFPEWMIGLATTGVVLGTAWFPPSCLEAVEYQRSNLRLEWFASRAPRESLAIVASGETSINTQGSPPWMAWRNATLVDLLTAISAAPQLTSDPGSAKE